MKKKLFTILLFGSLLSAYCTGVQEDKVYVLEEESEQFNSTLNLPFFLTEELYLYSKKEYETSIWHTYRIKDSVPNKGRGKTVIKDIVSIKPSVTTYKDLVESYDLPGTVIIAEQGNNFHLNITYGEVSFYFGVDSDVIREIRFENKTIFKYDRKITVGTSLDSVLKYYPASKTIEGVGINWDENNVIFKNINGTIGYHYIDYKSKGIRLFFANNKVSALYIYN